MKKQLLTFAMLIPTIFGLRYGLPISQQSQTTDIQVRPYYAPAKAQSYRRRLDRGFTAPASLSRRSTNRKLTNY